MKRVGVAIAVAVVLGAVVALWALAGSRRHAGPDVTQTARARRPAEEERDAPPAPGAEPRASAGTRDRADGADEATTEPRAVPGDEPGTGGDPGDWRPPAAMSEAERAKMREQALERMLDRAALTEEEKAAAEKTVEAKDRTRQSLAEALTDLRRASNKSNPTDRELRAALAAYRAALTRYRREVEAQDQALVKRLSLRAQVRCVSLGILDNGLGGLGPPGGMPRPLP